MTDHSPTDQSPAAGQSTAGQSTAGQSPLGGRRLAGGHGDPAGEAPWAMQLVVHAPKVDPPTRLAVCEAAATAVVSLLEANVITADWEAEIDRWLAGRIRKHVRRARGAKWEAVQDLPGVTVERGGAQVRAFVPGPTDAIPPAVGKLQLSGLSLPDPARPARDVEPGTLMVFLQPSPHLGDGKAAAACGHAAQVAWSAMEAGARYRWAVAGFPLVVAEPDPAVFSLLASGDADVVIHDAGFTEVDPGTVTATAMWA